MKWRIAKNKWNLEDVPWSDAIGIEEDDDTNVPCIICWFTRGQGQQEAAESVVRQHNESLHG